MKPIEFLYKKRIGKEKITLTKSNTERESEEKEIYSVLEKNTDATLVSPEKKEKGIKNLIFGHLLCKDLEHTLITDLKNTDLSEEIIEELKKKILALPIGQRKQVLAWPRELRIAKDKRAFFPRTVGQLEETGDTDAFLQSLLAVANRPDTQWTIGYHISHHNIRQEESGQWDVLGKEADPRDNDLSRAYYSLAYEDLYREKPGNFLYLIRGSKNDPNDGKWYRTGTLSIIHKTVLSDIERRVEEYYTHIRQKVEKKRDGPSEVDIRRAA